VALVAMFTIGGLSGVTHAVAASDLQQTDTYYIVAHFHYVIFGGALLGFLGGMYFWWPKVFGYRLQEGLGSWHFWLTLIGMNLTFGPMHIVGLSGQPRRTYTYTKDMGVSFWNAVETVGSFIIALSVMVFLFNVLVSYRKSRVDGAVTPADPWDGRSLEWMVPSPTPHHNFDTIPTVTELDEFWHRKYGEDEAGRPVRIAATEDVVQTGNTHPHLPAPSYWPIVVAFGLPIIAYGIIFNIGVSFVGGLIVLGGIYGWGLEPSYDDEPGTGHDDHLVPGGDGDDHGVAAPEPAGVTAGEPSVTEPASEETPVG
jgi:cytochrome c oxidase subunit 1